MDIMMWLLVILVPLAILLCNALRPVKCPDCGAALPVVYSPFEKTRRMWRAGGYLCARCGCETDMAGQKVTAETPPAPFPALHWALLAVGVLLGVGLICVILRVPAAASPPSVAPSVAFPQKAAAAALAN
jgi:hypothetical protein